MDAWSAVVTCVWRQIIPSTRSWFWLFLSSRWYLWDSFCWLLYESQVISVTFSCPSPFYLLASVHLLCPRADRRVVDPRRSSFLRSFCSAALSMRNFAEIWVLFNWEVFSWCLLSIFCKKKTSWNKRFSESGPCRMGIQVLPVVKQTLHPTLAATELNEVYLQGWVERRPIRAESPVLAWKVLKLTMQIGVSGPETV